MEKTELQFLMDYNYWANGLILHTAAQASAEQYTATIAVSFGSLRGTLLHILGAEIVWRLRIQGDILPYKMVGEDEFSTLAQLVERWAAEEGAMRAFLAGLDYDGANQIIQYKNSRGVAFQNPLWQILAHVVNHGTQFRSEAAVILTQLGYSPGDLDLIYYIRSR
jgi:uncharacterized damage-inducible protein DinB